MTRCLVLDAEAISALASRPSPRQREVRGALAAAARLERDVVVPALVLAELYRGARHTAAVALLAQESGFLVRPTDRPLARLVGTILAGARASSAMIVDAHVVAVAVEQGGGIVLTADPTDLNRLAAPYRNVEVVDIR